MMIVCLILALAAFGLSWFLTHIIRRQLVKKAMLDHPNERSMHTAPVPRGGGLAVLLVIGGGLLFALAISPPYKNYLWVLAAIVLLGMVSFLDDRKTIRSAVRLGVHVLAAYIGSLAFTSDQTLFAHHLPFWLDRTIMIIGWAWFINLYNFMDGIDGLTGVETISIASGIIAVAAMTGLSGAYIVSSCAVLIGACGGFLMLNWHPAKIFLGDVGSVPLGFFVGFLLLSLALNGYPAAALILPLYYLADSGITITKRLLRGEKIWQAHRQHFYQKAALGIGRHDKVVLWIGLTNGALILIAVWSILMPVYALGLACILVSSLLMKMHRIPS